jgi:hypothetical protein
MAAAVLPVLPEPWGRPVLQGPPEMTEQLVQRAPMERMVVTVHQARQERPAPMARMVVTELPVRTVPRAPRVQTERKVNRAISNFCSNFCTGIHRADQGIYGPPDSLDWLGALSLRHASDSFDLGLHRMRNSQNADGTRSAQ